MSVAVPVIDYIDGAARRIYLNQGVVDFYPIEDIYHEYRYLRANDESLRVWEPLLRAEGNVPKGGGAFTPRYVVLLLGTKIVPYDEPSQLNQLGDMITDDPDTDATLYDISQLTTAKPIFIKPSEAETIQLNSESIEFSSFQNAVTIDAANITGLAKAGTGFPAGTRQQPCINTTDAHTIADNRGLTHINVIGNLTLTTGDDFAGFEFDGESPLKTVITVEPGADVLNCEFYNCTVSGTLDGTTQIERAILTNLDFVDGQVFNCMLGPGEVTLGVSNNANLFNCFSAVPGSSTPVIDMNGTGVLGLRGYNGGVQLENYSGTGSHSIDLVSGQIKLDPNTITSGTFVCRGVGKLIDADTGLPIPTGEWNGGVTIINELINRTTIAEASKYGDAVYMDTVLGRPGTSDPIGLERDPVNNLADAITIAQNRGTSRIYIMKDYTFAADVNIVGYTFTSDTNQSVSVTFTAGCILAYCSFENVRMTGNIAGIAAARNCFMQDIGSVGVVPSSATLFLKDCSVGGTLTLPSNYSGTIIAMDCMSANSVGGYPTIDFGNSNANLVLRDFHGNMALENITNNNQLDLTVSAGEIELEPTVTSANIHFVGPAKLVDNTHTTIETGTWNGGVTVENSSIEPTTIREAVWNKIAP